MVPQGVDLMYKMSTLLLHASAVFLESKSKGYLNGVHLETRGGVLGDDRGSPHHFTNKKTESRKKSSLHKNPWELRTIKMIPFHICNIS